MSLLKWIFGTKPKRGRIVDLDHTPHAAPEDQTDYHNGDKTLSQLVAEKPGPTKPAHQNPAPQTAYRKGESMASKEARHRPAFRYKHNYDPSTAVTFCYMDAQGRLTDRTVTPISYDGESMEARCHLRRAQRTFYLDRIQGHVVIKNTGEVLTIEEWEMILQVF